MCFSPCKCKTSRLRSLSNHSQLLIASIFFCLSAHGCYSYQRGDYLGTEKIPGTEVVSSWTYHIDQVTKPTPETPSVDFRYEKSPQIRTKIAKKYSEIKVPSETVGLLMAGIGVGIGVSAEKIGDETTKGITSVLGILTILRGLDLSLEYPRPTGQSVDGEIGVVDEIGYATPMVQKGIVVAVDSNSKVFYTDSNGLIEVNLISDFNLRMFTQLQAIVMTVASQDPVTISKVTLNPNEWTSLHIRIDADRGWIFSKPTAESKKLSEYHRRELYKVIEASDPNWLEIQFPFGEGWIPIQAGKEIWMSVE